jgi:hypothetical protein
MAEPFVGKRSRQRQSWRRSSSDAVRGEEEQAKAEPFVGEEEQ